MGLRSWAKRFFRQVAESRAWRVATAISTAARVGWTAWLILTAVLPFILGLPGTVLFWILYSANLVGIVVFGFLVVRRHADAGRPVNRRPGEDRPDQPPVTANAVKTHSSDDRLLHLLARGQDIQSRSGQRPMRVGIPATAAATSVEIDQWRADVRQALQHDPKWEAKFIADPPETSLTRLGALATAHLGPEWRKVRHQMTVLEGYIKAKRQLQ